VTAFKGEELSEGRWVRYFSHYINLIFCLQILEFVDWYVVTTGQRIELPPAVVRKIGLTLGLPDVSQFSQLRELVENVLIEFESCVNSISDDSSLRLSLLAAPIDRLTSALCEVDVFRGKKFYFLIDEFENFEDYQQRIVNTLIKHASQHYTFKIGVRELGWRERATLNSNEQLTSPADYAHINIGDVMVGAKFKNFASDVVLSRLGLAHGSDEPRLALRTLLPRLSDLEEAEVLMESTQAHDIRTLAKKELRDLANSQVLDAIPAGKLLFAKYWNESFGKESLAATFQSLARNEPIWSNRVNNYFHSFLFSIRKGKAGIRKYYCGWDLYVRLADGNIRYLLELVHAAFRMHLEVNDGSGPIPPSIQTVAAQGVGKKNLDELQGLSVDGAHLTKLLLSLGRIFQIFAEDAAGHLAEANEFYIRTSDDGQQDQAAIKLLNSAVMHLALVRNTANKLADARDTKEYDYMVHPIFAPFFVFSSRRKRKIGLETSQLLRLVNSPREAIADVLRQNNRLPQSAELPDQLQLFGAFYE
jgi:hypothetical protein